MPRFIVPGSFQTTAVKYLPPDTVGLEYWAMLGANAAFSAKNHALGKADGAVFGFPTYSANSAAFNPSLNYLQTGAAHVASQTIIAVCRAPTEGLHRIVTNYNGPSASPPPNTTRGCSLYLSAGSAGNNLLKAGFERAVTIGGVDTFATTETSEIIPTNSWVCIAGRMNSATGERKIFNLSSGVVGLVTDINPQTISTSTFRIGGEYTSPPNISHDIAFAAIYNVVKTDAEIAAIYNHMKTYFSSRGIAI